MNVFTQFSVRIGNVSRVVLGLDDTVFLIVGIGGADADPGRIVVNVDADAPVVDIRRFKVLKIEEFFIRQISRRPASVIHVFAVVERAEAVYGKINGPSSKDVPGRSFGVRKERHRAASDKRADRKHGSQAKQDFLHSFFGFPHPPRNGAGGFGLVNEDS